MKRVHLVKLWLLIITCCPGLAACASDTSYLAPTTTPVSAVGPGLSGTRGPVVFFARDEDLWRATADGEHLERLTEGGVLDWRQNMAPDWPIEAMSRRPQVSPDGHWIVAIRSDLEFILIDLASGTQTPLAGPGAPDIAWSPDSQAFAYAPQSRTDDVELRVYNVEDGEADTLLSVERTTGLDIHDIVWSPDNRFIAFGCCFKVSEPEAYTGTLLGEIRVVEVATGEIQSVGKMESHVASRSRLCWTEDGQVVTSSEEGIVCSYSPPVPNILSPSGTARAVLAPLAPDDESWTGPSRLTVSLPASGQTLWEREISRNVKTVVWAPDGGRGTSAYLFLDDYELNSPIWRIAADGASGLEKIVADGFLLGVVPQWQEALSRSRAETKVPAAGPSPGMTSLPSWDHVLFVWNQDGVAELWTLDPVSCAVKRQVRPEHTVQDPALSPSGETIAYVRSTGDYGGVPSELWVMDKDGTNPRPLYVPVPGQGVFSRITWQPDGQAIYFVQSGSGAGHQLLHILIEGGEATTILTDCLDFALHPDGESLVAMSLDRRLGVFAPDGSRLRALAPDGVSFSDYYSFAPSPDGRWLAFRGTERGGVDTWNLYVMDWNGRNVRRLTDLKGFHPATAGTGQVNGLAWAGWIGDKAQIVYSVDGHPQRAGIWLADLRGRASTKLFSPQGEWFAVRGPWFEPSTR